MATPATTEDLSQRRNVKRPYGFGLGFKRRPEAKTAISYGNGAIVAPLREILRRSERREQI